MPGCARGRRTVLFRGWCHAMQAGMHIMHAVLATAASSPDQDWPCRPQIVAGSCSLKEAEAKHSKPRNDCRTMLNNIDIPHHVARQVDGQPDYWLKVFTARLLPERHRHLSWFEVLTSSHHLEVLLHVRACLISLGLHSQAVCWSHSATPQAV